ncbi:MAG: hypothetical protein M3O29_08340 [Actinomycetota bacterium]|nr:hypothetical protein [Actinomycetota bacterium]
MTLPDWPELRARMLAPKPAVTFIAYTIGRDPLNVRYDGEGSFILAETGRQLVGEAWITSAIEPRRFVRLHHAEGVVTGREQARRPAIVAEVRGLRGATTMRLWIDEEVGCIVRMERVDDPAPLIVLDDLLLDDQSFAESGKGTSENTRHSTRS